MRPIDECPCGSGAPFGTCCLALHRGESQAGTAEQLMRARYSAYAVGDLDYVWQTWHPRTRLDALTPADGLTWTGLEIVGTSGGGMLEPTGTVEFRAAYTRRGVPGEQHELSSFVRESGNWVYRGEA